MFEYCDRAHKLPCTDEAVVIIAIVFHEIKKPTEIETSDPSIASHLKQVLQSRLQVLCSRIPDFDAPEEVKPTKGTPNAVVALMISRIQEFSSYVPPQYNVTILLLESSMSEFIPVHAPVKPGDLPACLLLRFDDGECCDGNAETEDCCCAWISDSIPSSLLKFFGHSIHSFADYVHSDSRKTTLEDVGDPTDPRQALNTMFKGIRKDSSSLKSALNTMFKGIGKDDSSLANRMIVFSGALFLGFCFLLDSIDSLTSEDDIIERIKLPEDQLIHLAEGLRQHLFTCILPPAVSLYHEFWDSEIRGKTHNLTTTNEFYFGFKKWALKRPDLKTKFFTKKLEWIIFDDLISRLQAKLVGLRVADNGKDNASVRMFSQPH